MLRVLVAAVVVLLLVALIAAVTALEAQAQAPVAVAAPGETPAAPASSTRCEHGITLAMGGERNRAESVFVSLLSEAPGDARALNNLGNLRVLDADYDVALAFYNQAYKIDPKDAGVRINRATTLMLLGDIERAEAEAAEAVKQAGGEAEAARLVGLTTTKDTSGARASEKPFVSKQEIRALLSAAKARVPGDSVPPTAADSTRAKSAGGQKPPTWRSAGPRAGDIGDLATLLYWKR
jgi:Flp pilus assembly protein TadD